MAFIFLQTLEIDSMASFGAGRWDAIGKRIRPHAVSPPDDSINRAPAFAAV